ncbi:ATP-dependent protease [Thermococcus sp. M39]|uniref:S16 family serine protease n=1 Tax=unclassified Thermococcus TaxID=2627626 RepID=UPI00143BFEA7|nr:MULTISPECIES: S16 family serine protease [unclassified Thermococcus]NJE09052.1 ATP-dependent protease [Thermococcus sp. M39]NJE13283.1 ATP-dependent protease [Thermococcus sp. LS2]
MRKLFPILALILLLSPLALAQCPVEGHTVILKAPAVSKTANGDLIGVATEFVITVAPGSGHVYVETWPLAEVDMQASARLAAQVAGRVLGVDMSKYDVFIQVKADSPIIGGPSAGGTMTVGIIAALKGWKLRDDVMMTGMINPDGTIGPVGGILEKASAAHSVGAKLFLIPEGQRIQVVQKTEQKQIGPLVQITTKEEKVDVVEYAKERWGLEVREIKDIYEAVYYFTGHKIEKPQAPANVKIDTSFLKEDAEKDYENTTKYYKQVEKKLKESDVSYTTYSYLKAALDDASKTLKDAKEALDSGMYYTALSKDFQARIIIRHVDWYLDVQDEKDIEKLLNMVNEDIKDTENYVSNLTIRGTTMLQAVAASEERIEQAKSLLKDAWSDYYKGDYWNAVSNAAFAYERVQTAKFWAKLGERYAKGDVISRDVIKDTAREYLDNARLVVTYITSMFGETLMQGLVDKLNQGEQYYEDGKYSAALFSAMEARIRAEVILDTLGIDNETVLMDKLQQMKEDAKTAIAIAQSQGVYPILGMAYYEFAQSYEKQGGIENIQTAMIFYQYAKETAMMFLPKTTPKITEETTTPQIAHPTPSSTATQTDTQTQTTDTVTTSTIPVKSVPTSLLGGIGALGVILGLIIGIVVGRRV